MKTEPKEFEKWVDSIPDDCFPFLIPIRKGGKSPDVPKGKSWKNHTLSIKEAYKRLEKGKNVAYVPQGDLAVLDVDDIDKAQDYIDDSFMKTLVIQTRSGKLHLYYRNGGVENKDIPGVIEIRTKERYLLIPGSYVPPGDTSGDGIYKVVDGRNLKTLKSEELPRELKPSNGGSHTKDFETVEANFDGEWISRPCIKKMYDTKLPDGGRRTIAGKYLSMAYYLDRGNDKKGFIKFISEFAKEQDKDHTHRPTEYCWLSTIKRKGMDWNCKEIRNYFADASIPYPCGACPIYNEELKKRRVGND